MQEIRNFFQSCILLLFSSFVWSAASAQTKIPTDITIVTGVAGGTSDLIARNIAEGVKRNSGLRVVVVNKAPLQVLQDTSLASPDGRILGIVDSYSAGSYPAITKNFSLDPAKDLTPVIGVSATPYILIASTKMGIADYQGLINLLRSSPGKYSYSSSGVGTPSHLHAELFKALTGTFITQINGKSSAMSLLAVTNGDAAVGFFELPLVLPAIKNNQVVPIAISAPRRMSVLQATPTFSEIELSPLNRMHFRGIVGPKDMPAELTEKLNLLFKNSLEDPETKQRIHNLGAMVMASSSNQFSSLINSDITIYGKVVSAHKLEIQTAEVAVEKSVSASNLKSEQVQDNSEDDALCKRYGLTFGTADYADCRIKILNLRQTAQSQNRDANRLIELQEEQRRARIEAQGRADSDALIRLGMDMLGGKARFTDGYKYLDGAGAPNTSENSSGKPTSVTRTVTLPNGKMVTCTTFQSMTNCF